MDKKYFYRRKLPHWQPEEATFFVTYRLSGSLPITVIEHLKEEYSRSKDRPENQTSEKKDILHEEYFYYFENELERNPNEPHWLKDNKVAEIVLDSLLFNNNKHYILWAVCIMSNHVHALLTTVPGSPLLHVILQNHKKFTAVQCNKVIGRIGKFWAEESYDTLIRNEAHYYRVVNYIIKNPVKANLVNNWTTWKWTYLHPELKKDFLIL